MLQRSRYGTFEWYFGCLVEAVYGHFFYPIDETYCYLVGLFVGRGSNSDNVHITQVDLCKVLIQIAFESLSIKERKKHGLKYYEEQHLWMLEAL